MKIVEAAYYNEIDPFSAQWLKNLMKRRLIMDGDVDERSIVDVAPSDVMNYREINLFAGIGVWSYAFKQAGFSGDGAPSGGAKPRQGSTKSTPQARSAAHIGDAGDPGRRLSASCPCQPFSMAGKQAGFDDERHLWPAAFRLIQQCGIEFALANKLHTAALRLGSILFNLTWKELATPQGRSMYRLVASAAHTSVSVPIGAPGAESTATTREYGTQDGVRVAKQSRRSTSLDAERVSHGRVQREALGIEERQATERGGDADFLANSESKRQYGREDTTRTARWLGTEVSGDVSFLGNTAGTRRDGKVQGSEGEAWHQARLRGAGEPGAVSAAGRVAQSRSQRRQQDAQGAPGDEGTHGRRAQGDNITAGDGADRNRRGSASKDFWRDVDWVPCTDGVYRPVESGSQPLVDGTAERLGRSGAGSVTVRNPQSEAGRQDGRGTSANRVGRLRGYGNAICAPVAVEFLKAVMACKP